MRFNDNLTQAISKITGNVNSILTTLDQPSYDEIITIVSGAPVGNQLTGPVLSGTTITIPVNSRLIGTPQQYYVVGKGTLEVFLNGQYLSLFDLSNGWQEVGATGSNSSQIQINQTLQVGDVLTFRLDATGGPGSGGAGAPDDNFYLLPTSSTANNSDYLLIYDVTVPGYRKQLRSVFLAGLSNLQQVNTYTTNHTANATTDDVILVDATSGTVTITLPAPTTCGGKEFNIKKIDSSGNGVVVDGNGVDIDGSGTISTVIQYENFTVVADATNNQYWIL